MDGCQENNLTSLNSGLQAKLKEIKTEEVTTKQVGAEDVNYELDKLPASSVGRKLNRQQRDYCRYRVATGNIKRSAKLAGYTDGYGYLAEFQPHIQEFIAELKAYKLANSGYSKEKLIETLGAIAVHDVTDYVSIDSEDYTTKVGTTYSKNVLSILDTASLKSDIATDENNEPILDSEGNTIAIDSLRTLAIKGFKVDERGNITPEFYDRMQAIDKLAKIYDLYGSTKIDIKDVTAEVDKKKETLLSKLEMLKSSIESDTALEEEQKQKESVGE